MKNKEEKPVEEPKEYCTNCGGELDKNGNHKDANLAKICGNKGTALIH